jgi:hypothetical protein
MLAQIADDEIAMITASNCGTNQITNENNDRIKRSFFIA